MSIANRGLVFILVMITKRFAGRAGPAIHAASSPKKAKTTPYIWLVKLTIG
jgi:hypothetical protein